MWPIRCPETSVKAYYSMLRNIPEGHRSQLELCLPITVTYKISLQQSISWKANGTSPSQYIPALYTWGRNSFSSVSRLPLQLGDWNIICGTPYACAESSASLVEIGRKCRALGIPSPCATTSESLVQIGRQCRALYSWGKNSFSSYLALQRGDWNITCGNPCAFPIISVSFVAIGQ
jgi:hypothetical protein